jgi:hypothetical protein
MPILDRIKPGVSRRTLFFVAAGAWLTAGSILLYRGEQALGGDIMLTLCGVGGGLVFFRFLFQRITGRHIKRIRSIVHARPCLFSFLDWRGYGLMTLMISGGILVRTSGVVPPLLLGALSVGMGTPLVISSLRFAGAGLRDEV